MSVYRAAVCEDEEILRESIAGACREILDGWAPGAEVLCFESADALRAALESGAPDFDLYLLDIQMEGTDGLAFARWLYERGVRDRVIFITGSAEYALAGYGAHPLHYLLKPLDRAELEDALRMAWERRGPRTLVFRSGGRMTALPAEDISYLESRNHGAVIHIGGEELALPVPLTEAERSVPAGSFAHCHKSYLVNLAWVAEVGRTELRLRGGETLPVSRRCYAPFQSALVRYLNNA